MLVRAVNAVRVALVGGSLLSLPSSLRPEARASARKETRDTESLDGVRGWAFAVYVEHFVTPIYPSWLAGYGQLKSSSFLQLPFLRLIYSGNATVAVFLVISGSVLSQTTMKLTREGRYETAFRSLATSIFRRGFRLYLPPVALTFLVMLATRASLYEDPLLAKFQTRGPVMQVVGLLSS